MNNPYNIPGLSMNVLLTLDQLQEYVDKGYALMTINRTADKYPWPFVFLVDPKNYMQALRKIGVYDTPAYGVIVNIFDRSSITVEKVYLEKPEEKAPTPPVVVEEIGQDILPESLVNAAGFQSVPTPETVDGTRTNTAAATTQPTHIVSNAGWITKLREPYMPETLEEAREAAAEEARELPVSMPTYKRGDNQQWTVGQYLTEGKDFQIKDGIAIPLPFIATY